MAYAAESPQDEEQQLAKRNAANADFRQQISTPEGLQAYNDKMAQNWHDIQTQTGAYQDFGGGGFLDKLGSFLDPVMETAIKATPLALGVGLGGAALGGLGIGAGALPTASTGAAAATGGAAASGGIGGLSSVLGGVGSNALSSMGVKAATNLLTGRPLTSGVLQSGLFSGLGGVGASLGGNFIGQGLSSLGMTPETVAMLKAPITSGMLSTGYGMLSGQPFSKALTNGLLTGATSFGGQQLNSYLKGTDLSQPTQQILGSAGKGAISSTLHGNNPVTGAISGAASGAVNAGSNALFGGSNNTASGAKMPDPTNTGDNTDWLGSLYTNLNPTQAPYDPNFIDYGAGASSPGTDGTSDNFTVGNLLDPNNDVPDALNGGISFGDIGSGMGDGLNNTDTGSSIGYDPSSSGGSGGFLNNLFKQLTGAGNKAAQNPLGAIATALTAYQALAHPFGAPNNTKAVTDMLAAHKAAGASMPVVARAPVFGHDPSAFTQQYDTHNAPMPLGMNPVISELYNATLHRNPDAQGAAFWSQQLGSGATNPAAIRAALMNSPEYKATLLGNGPLSQLGG